VEGNYPTFVYIPVTINDELRQNFALLRGRAVQQNSHAFKEIIAEKEEELHISLSRTFALREHQIEPFIEVLATNLKKQRKKFFVTLLGFEWFTNDEKTRSFFSLSLDTGLEKTLSLISGVDEVLKQFGLPLYYKDPRPHVTIGWIANDVFPLLNSVAGDIDSDLVLSLELDRIECKCGKWTYII